MYQITIVVFLVLLIVQLIHTSRIVDTRTVTEKQGRDVILACRFERLQERDRVMWSKDDVVLSVNTEISGDKRKYEITDQYNLIIKSVVGQDSGRYLCQNFDQALSINVHLTVLTRPSQPDLQQTNRSLVEHQIGRFLCVTKGGNPLPTFQWLLNDIQLNESSYHIYPNTRQSYSELHLPLEKRFHNAILTCQIHNQALDKPLQASFTLNIQYKPEVSLHSNRTVVSNVNLLVTENDHLTIDCQIDSNPSLIKPIIWLKNGVLILGNTSPSLVLRSIKRADDGEYACSSTNAIGQSQSSVNIRVQYSPLIELIGGGIKTENERLVLSCNANSYPLIDYYQWYKNNEKLNTSALTSSIVIEKVSKEDAGNYGCIVKNTLKYSNGSAIERFNKTQIKVLVQYVPKVHAEHAVVAADLQETNIELHCQIDTYPEATVRWKFENRILLNSTKYSILQKNSSSYLILHQIESTIDYGFYSCNATNKLGSNSTNIQLRSKDVPDSPRDFNVTNVSYSAISVQWKPGFDGGWPQSFWISLDNSVWKETNQTQFTFTKLQPLEHYNITVRAHNQLGQSAKSAFLRVQTKDLPIGKEELPLLEYSSLHVSERSIHYRINDSVFTSLKVPLCIRIEVSNYTHTCQRLVTSSGMIKLDKAFVNRVVNTSICLDQYENFCGEIFPVQIKRETTFNWIFIIVSSVITVTLLILIGLCIFCLILKRRKRRRNPTHSLITISNKKPSQHPVILEPVTSNSTKFFSNITYPEQQQISPSYLNLDQFPGKLCNTSSEQKSTLSSSEQLSVTDLNQSLVQNQTTSCPPENITYGFPYYENNDRDDNDGVYSTPMKNDSSNKKTVYEVVV
ncbi:unnamed protein product [Adineta ricciae]|uniref:Uncharacterized protein n=1 Tax=Adineta ricciae TaxID=249248 RepID=A0A814SS37_ADIRI|nr:unnamed protein product [Adineta ricciae]